MILKRIRGIGPILFTAALALPLPAAAQGVPTIDLTSIAKIGEVLTEAKLQVKEMIASNLKLDEQILKQIEQIATLKAQLDALRNGLTLEALGIPDPDTFFDDILPDVADLTGGLITSSESAERAGNNQFSTGTLSWRDLNNHSDYEGSGFGIGGTMSMNTDMGLGKDAAPQSGKTVTDENGNTQLATGYASLDKNVTFGIGHDSGSDSSTTRSGINTDNITITRPDGQQQAIEGVKTDITTETAAANSGRLENNFDKDDVFKELNLQVSVTRDFKENANRQIGDLLNDQQAAAREALQQAIKSGDTVKQNAALDEIYKLQYQRRFLQTLVGIVAGSPEAAVTQGTLVLAATKLREETAKNSLLSPGIVDIAGGPTLSNVSAESSAYDGLKLGGVRVGLDIICGADNGRCKTKVDAGGNVIRDANNVPVLDYDAQGRVQYTGNKQFPTLVSILKDDSSAGLYGFTGGLQGDTGLFGKLTYAPGTLRGDFFDTLVEGFAGTHDYIGGQVPGFYDETGNTSRDRSALAKMAAEGWTYAAIPQAAPFALSEIASPELLEFIFATH